MQAYRFETTVQENGTLQIKDLPLSTGEQVEVIILLHHSPSAKTEYPLRGTSVIYHDPFKPVDDAEWVPIDQHGS